MTEMQTHVITNFFTCNMKACHFNVTANDLHFSGEKNRT